MRSAPIIPLSTLILIVILTACTPPAPDSGYDDPHLLFRDDFSAPTSGWDRHTEQGFITDYDDGRYLIAVEDTEVNVWAKSSRRFSDLEVKVEATHSAGPLNNEFGLMCRYRENGSQKNFYFFLISSDGYYAVGKIIQGRRTYLGPNANFATAEAIRTGAGATNELSAVCAGNKMSFRVNGVLLAEFEDNELTRGDIGLIAGTFEEGGVRLHFDNLEVRRP